MYANQAHNQYRQSQVQATPERLLVTLYDGLLRFLRQGANAMKQRDLETQSLCITKAQRILLELDRTLDHEAGGEVAAKLDSIYRYCLDRLTYANHQDDLPAMHEVLEQMTTLRGAWAEAERIVRKQRAAGIQTQPAGQRTGLSASA